MNRQCWPRAGVLPQRLLATFCRPITHTCRQWAAAVGPSGQSRRSPHASTAQSWRCGRDRLRPAGGDLGLTPPSLHPPGCAPSLPACGGSTTRLRRATRLCNSRRPSWSGLCSAGLGSCRREASSRRRGCWQRRCGRWGRCRTRKEPVRCRAQPARPGRNLALRRGFGGDSVRGTGRALGSRHTHHSPAPSHPHSTPATASLDHAGAAGPAARLSPQLHAPTP